MTDEAKTQDWGEAFWYRGKVTRRRLIGYTSAAAGALGATMLVPAPWQAAFGQAKPYKIGTEQPLSGAGAAGGKTALVGVQMAVDRINKSGGVNGRPIELIVADDESKPDVGRRKVEKLLVEDNVDVHVGGFLSNICLACMPVFEEYKVVNIISVCLDTTLTTTKCNRYSFRPYDYAPAVDRIRLGSCRRTRRDHAGTGAMAGRLRSGQALQDRYRAAAVGRWRRRRQDRAGRRADGDRPHQQIRRC